MPASQAARPDVVGTLKEETQGSGTSRRKSTLSKALVVVQVALSVVALVAAFSLAAPATAVTYSPTSGGSVTKAELLTALGWTDSYLEAHVAQLTFSVASYRKAKQDCTKTTPGHTFTVAFSRWQEGTASVPSTIVPPAIGPAFGLTLAMVGAASAWNVNPPEIVTV
mgnify:CR=1 FL=1